MDDGLDSSGEGGGTVVSSCLTIRNDRLFRGFDADALKAFSRSPAEKESLRGSWVPEDGIGMASVMVVID